MDDLGTVLLWVGLIELIMVALALLVIILESQKNRRPEYNLFGLGMTAFFLHLLCAIFFSQPINYMGELSQGIGGGSPAIVSDTPVSGDDASLEGGNGATPFWLVLNHALLIAGVILLAYSLILPKLESPVSDNFAVSARFASMAAMTACLLVLLLSLLFAKGSFQWGVGDVSLHLVSLAIISLAFFTIYIHLPGLMLYLKVAFGLLFFSKLSVLANIGLGGANPVLYLGEYVLECFSYMFIIMAVNQLSSEDLRALFDQLKNRTEMLERMTKRLSKLNQLSTDLLQTTDTHNLMERILDSVSIGMGYQQSFILLVDLKENLLRGWRLNKTSGKPENFFNTPLTSESFLVDAFFKGKTQFWGEGTRLPDHSFMQNYQFSKDMVTIPLQTKKDTFCWDVHECTETNCPIRTWSLPECWQSREECSYYDKNDLGSYKICLECPAFNVIGVLVVDNRSSTLKLDEKNIPLLETFSNQAGIALHNAVLMDDLAAEVNFREETFKNLPTGVIVVDRKGRIATINPAQERILRTSRDEIIGKRFDEIRVVNDMPLLTEIVANTLKGGEGYDEFGTTWDLTLSDAELQLSIRVSPLPGNEESGGVIVLTDDVTDRLRLERQLFHSEKLATIGQMAAGIAHEVNNPLAGVSGFLQVLASRLPEDSPEKVPIDAALKGITRASKTIKDLLKFAKPAPAEKKPTDINQLITDSLMFISYQPRHKHIRLLRDLDEFLPNVLADPGQVSQVLDNIIINALHAMEDEGILRVATSLSGNWVHTYITDTGPGIVPDDIPRIFDPFFTTKASGEGTGLGLSTCDRIISEHGGTIAVYSVPNEETTFVVRLPVTEEEMARFRRRKIIAKAEGASEES